MCSFLTEVLTIRKQLESNRRIPGRSMIILLGFMMLWCIIILRLFKLQIIDYNMYQNKVINNIQRVTTLSADRGEIYDANMNKLATNYSVYRIFISPRDINTKDSSAEKISQGLSDILGVSYDSILAMTKKTNRADETVLKKASEEQANAVRKFILENNYSNQIHIETNTARYYPFSSLASNVIGVVGTDGGLTGLEYQYNTFLLGESGKYITAKDAQGNQMPSKYDTYIDASNGANLVTTIDVTIQKALEKQLKQTYLDSNPLNRVTGIVMDVNTGAVLAMATYPNFDLNSPFTLDEASIKKLEESNISPDTTNYTEYQTKLLYQLWRNKAVSELYEPGSTFKIITTAMGLEESLISLNESFTCTGSMRVSGYPYPIHCHKKGGHGALTFERGLQQSCNPVIMQLGLRIGKQSFYEYFQAFGYTGITGIDLPGEEKSIYSSYNDFSNVSLAVYSFGQTFKVTPIMQLSAIASIANGGYLVTPYLVNQIIDDDGNILMQHETDYKRQIISNEVCSTISGVLERGVSGDGGAKNAYVAGYKIAAKTGTSEVRDQADPDGNYSYRVGSTVAYAPADNPKVASIIIVDTPTCNNKYGSVVAAPYISNLMEEILPYLGVERNYSEEEYAKLKTTLGSYVGWPQEDAVKAVSNRGLSYEVIGNGDVIKYQIPSKGEEILKKEGKIYFYTGDISPSTNIKVPNVVGKTVSAANRSLTNSGFNVIIDGATVSSSSTEAYVVSQSIDAGSMSTKGTVVRITVRYLDGTA